ncbi:glycoside hydrolase [Podospora didyma]|uniref:Glycoside hydrolase n=1 Tax=Podospora didyma TaxID=330526 RepID=A0AAE0U480_9PEZI|nr:glycoside hydrolase [Podospora didyma]
MVSAALAARAALLVSAPLKQVAYPIYAQHASDAAKALQGWYDPTSGLWNGWWNSANCLTVLCDWALLDRGDATALNISAVVSNTFNQAQMTSMKTTKRMTADGRVISTYQLQPQHKRTEPGLRGFSNFINDFYDDQGWWALALIRSWDLTHVASYLNMAEHIFDDMKNGTDNTCGGGIWWSKERKYKNAIANELYLSVAASLANRVPVASKKYYVDIAKAHWEWFKQSGMINSNNLINDGLHINDDGTCVNNRAQTWSYNQGVVLGGLVELAKAANNSAYVSEANSIATAAIALLSSDSNGIIHEVDHCEPNCGDDGSQFKGVFVRNLHYLQTLAPQESFRAVILKNADSIWANNRNARNQLGINWAGPADAGSGPTATTHTSAMDVIVAALALVH